MAFSQKQIEYTNNADKRWNIKTGATRSGKTYLDYTYVIPKRIRSRIGKEGLVVILGVTKSTIERNVLEPMRNLYGDNLVGTINSQNKCYLFGEWVYCLGAEKVTQVSKIRGASIKYCYGDEVADWSEEVFNMLKSRLDKEYSCFDGALNPQSPSHWLKKFLDSDADIYCQKYTIFDNPFLTKEFVDNLCKEYEGSVYYKRYILGEWAIAEGLVYGMFSTEKNVFDGPIPASGACMYWLAVDYGTMNPFAVGLMEMDRFGRVRMLKEKHYSGREQGATVDNEQYYKMLEEIAEGYPVQSIIIDPSAAGMKATIKKYGRFGITDGINDVLNGIQEVTKYINAGYFQVHDSCVETRKEFEAYSWDDKAVQDTVIKENDHHMDLIRYFIYTIARKYNKGRL
ncbi:MAG: PBSX family phage terminase large subunit [Prevotellaceae bacterium]|nr:PBSX family phage terminase large subunit [Prevotellaceae bacterium]